MFTELEQNILARQMQPKAGSYTCRLLAEKYLVERKVHEELYEVLEAAFTRDREQLIYEAGDLMYHLLVLFRKYDIALEEINQELKRREK